MMNRLLAIILLFLSLKAYSENLTKISVAKGKTYFIKAQTNELFFPYGVNFDHNRDYILLEDFWTDKEYINTVFKDIKQMGFNIVRIHLQQFKLQISKEIIDNQVLNKITEVVDIAKKYNLYIDLTGLGRYNGKIPDWYKDLTDNERNEVDRSYWETLAIHLKNNSSIFCFNIQNEPTINSSDNQGYVGPPFKDGYHYINRLYQNIAEEWNKYLKEKYNTKQKFKVSWVKYKYKNFKDFSITKISTPEADASKSELKEFRIFKDNMAVLWLKQIYRTIKKADNSRLVTIGLSNLNFKLSKQYASFSPEIVYPYVDFISIHTFPREISKFPYKDNSGSITKMVKAAYIGKPLVIEEFYPLVPLNKLYPNFIFPINKYVSGWISYYWGTPIEALKGSSEISDNITGTWLEYFSKNKNKIIGNSKNNLKN